MKLKWKLIFLFVTIVSGYLIWDKIEGRKDEKRRQIFNAVQKGMTEGEVIEILGKPDSVFYSPDSSMEYEYFTKEYSGIGKSGMPTIVFDTNRMVKYSDFGD